MGAFGSSFLLHETRDLDAALRDKPSASDMRGGMRRQSVDDGIRVAALTGGDPSLAAQVLKDIAPTVWAACTLLTSTEAREAFLEIIAKLREDNFALLRDYTGRGTLQSFVAVTVRDLLSQRMLQLFHSDQQKAWRAFENFFKDDFLRLIHRRLPGAKREDARREAYQTISLALIDQDYRRLKAYKGSGSFVGFVLRTADHLLIDFIRSLASRRRLPNAVARLPELDREVFRLVNWQNVPERPDVLAPYLTARFERAPDHAAIAVALLRVKAYARAEKDARPRQAEADLMQIADAPESSPEAQLVQAEEDEQLHAAVDVLNRAIETLPVAERLYLTIVLNNAQTPSAREIARLMQRPVEDVYKLKQRVLNHLREIIAEESAVKNWRASV